MKRTILLLFVLIISCAKGLLAQVYEEPYNAYGKIHLGFTLEQDHYAINTGGSYGFYLTDYLGMGIGVGLITYHSSTTYFLIEGGGIECSAEIVVEPLSRNMALSVFGGMSFLHLEEHTADNDNASYIDNYGKRQPLIGMAIDYYVLPRLSIGLRSSYAFINDYGSLWPSVRMDLSLGTRF